MFQIMVLSFCAFCVIPKETAGLNLDKRSINHNSYFTNHGKPVKILSLSEEDILDSDEDTIFDLNSLSKEHFGKHFKRYGPMYYSHKNANPKEERFHHNHYHHKHKIPKVHSYKGYPIVTQPKKTLGRLGPNAINYEVGENVYAGNFEILFTFCI